MTNEISRREFLGTMAAGAVAVGLMGSETRGQSTRAVGGSWKLRQFDQSQVKLTGGPLKEQFDRTGAYYLGLDDDRILKVYRQTAGMSAPGAEMGGWYDFGGFGPGHGLGQWLSALSRYYKGTGDVRYKEKVQRLVDGLAATLGAEKSFYAVHRFPAYTFDKHVIGLTEAYSLAGVANAKEVLARLTEQAAKVLPEKALTREEQAARPHKDASYTYDEHYTLPENLFLAYEVMGDERYLEMAKRFLHDKPYFDPLSRGENVLPGLHAYSHVNCLSSGAKAYLVLGDEKYRRAIVNAWEMLEKTQWFASGGWGPNEAFVKPGSGGLGDSITKTHKHFETPCGSYAHFKLARYLMRITGESRYGDGLERMLYNGILAAKPMGPEGQTFYYSDYSPGAQKVYHRDKWPCCSGTYPQVVADYLVSAYFQDEEGVYVNLYVPSELKAGGMAITQETEYPEKTTARFKIGMAEAKEMSLRFRMPGWASEIGVSVNGEIQKIAARPGTFAEVRRVWKDGDVVDVTIPLAYRAEVVDERHGNLVAMMRGPVMMVGVSGEMKFKENGEGEVAVRMMPFYQVKDEIYTVYGKRG